MPSLTDSIGGKGTSESDPEAWAVVGADADKQGNEWSMSCRVRLGGKCHVGLRVRLN